MPLHSTVSQIHPPSFVLRRSWLWGALAIVPMGTAWAQVAAAGAAEAASQTFTLGTVEVSARREAEELERHGEAAVRAALVERLADVRFTIQPFRRVNERDERALPSEVQAAANAGRGAP